MIRTNEPANPVRFLRKLKDSDHPILSGLHAACRKGKARGRVPSRRQPVGSAGDAERGTRPQGKDDPAAAIHRKTGLSLDRIAEAIGFARSMVCGWLARLAAGGAQRRHDRKSPGRPCQLDGRQRVQLDGIIRESPERSGFHSDMWISRMAAGRLWKVFGVWYSSSSALRLTDRISKPRCARNRASWYRRISRRALESSSNVNTSGLTEYNRQPKVSPDPAGSSRGRAGGSRQSWGTAVYFHTSDLPGLCPGALSVYQKAQGTDAAASGKTRPPDPLPRGSKKCIPNRSSAGWAALGYPHAPVLRINITRKQYYVPLTHRRIKII